MPLTILDYSCRAKCKGIQLFHRCLAIGPKHVGCHLRREVSPEPALDLGATRSYATRGASWHRPAIQTYPMPVTSCCSH